MLVIISFIVLLVISFSMLKLPTLAMENTITNSIEQHLQVHLQLCPVFNCKVGCKKFFLQDTAIMTLRNIKEPAHG